VSGFGPAKQGKGTDRRVIGLAITIGLVIAGYLMAWVLNTVVPFRPQYALSDLIAPSFFEPLVGIDLGAGTNVKTDILVQEAPDIDVIRADLRESASIRPDVDAPPEGTLLICDFDKDGETVREWTCPAGSWISDPTDPTIKFLEAYDPIQRYGDKGFSLKLWYDIESPNPAYGGLWIQFKQGTTHLTLDASPYRAISLMIKRSSSEIGGTSRLKIEMKNQAEMGSVVLSGITAEWKRFEIPLTRFKDITDWTRMKEMTVVLDKDHTDKSEGLLYFDEVMFIK
jgi:hypothetical protein